MDVRSILFIFAQKGPNYYKTDSEISPVYILYLSATFSQNKTSKLNPKIVVEYVGRGTKNTERHFCTGQSLTLF